MVTPTTNATMFAAQDDDDAEDDQSSAPSQMTQPDEWRGSGVWDAKEVDKRHGEQKQKYAKGEDYTDEQK